MKQGLAVLTTAAVLAATLSGAEAGWGLNSTYLSEEGELHVQGLCNGHVVNRVEPSLVVDISAVPAGHLPGNASCVEYNYDTNNKEVCLDTRPCNLADPDRGQVLCLGEGENPPNVLDVLREETRRGNCFHIKLHAVEVTWVTVADPPSRKDVAPPLDAGKVAGIVIAVLIALFVAGFALWWWFIRPRMAGAGSGYAKFGAGPTSSTPVSAAPPLAGATGYQSTM